jgi:hypothetical protein
VRVCLVYDCLFPHTVGGGERWYRALAERLAADGHQVTYLTLRRQGHGARGAAPPSPADAHRAVRDRQAAADLIPLRTSRRALAAAVAALYAEATVGLCLSLTNFSLMPKEMLACGLPCVELAGVSAESIFGDDGPLALAPLDPVALADAIERLLDDLAEWERRSREGVAFVASHTWDVATDEVEAGVRHALATSPAGLRSR